MVVFVPVSWRDNSLVDGLVRCPRAPPEILPGDVVIQ